jgi:hypothetical protein
MAWRIEEQVVRGEIDNRTRGRVTGRIWLAGREQPIELELKGNAGRDLAGRQLVFVNPSPKQEDLTALAELQSGVVGDCTASRKAKVPDVSHDELMRLMHDEKPFPWHWANCVYIEWFSERNGRVIIESANFELSVTSEATWRMSAEEEEEQRRANAAALTEFMRRLGRLAPPFDAAPEAPEKRPSPPPVTPKDEKARDPDRPQTEAEAEAAQREHDKLLDRINARIEREGADADYEKILEEELDRLWRERGEEPPSAIDEQRLGEWMADMSHAAEESESGEAAEFGHKHPIAERAKELVIRLRRDARGRGWVPPGSTEEHPVQMLVLAATQAGAKFAGALNGGAWPPDVYVCAGKIVRLKRARGFIEDALLAAESCREQHLVDAVWLSSVVKELSELAGACDALVAELRRRLG